MNSKISCSDLEQTKCPMCSSNDNIALHNFDPVNVVKCKMCGLIYLNPRLNEEYIYKHYAEDEFYNNYTTGIGYEIQEHALRGTFEKFFKILDKRIHTGGRLLEIGCGFGYLLDISKKYFSYCVGTDFSESAVDIAKNYCDEVYCGGLDAIPENTGKFDFIIAFSVLEHVYNPNEFIKEISSNLKTGGTLIISTPDVGSYWSKILRKKWPFYIPTEHVCLYKKDTLEYLFKQNNFTVINSFSFSHGWPLVAFLSKVGLRKIAKHIANKPIAKKTIYIPNTIICTYGIKNN
ncbi:class I SAM-dependent methyltransferase [uncultured Clostridium sp.]|uniref:class I SAM-dependent methyltransferase n=1 Tax=uncultured Clostridium sp. TaxID=59620 RepID=UPI0028E26FF0|nr:class I SAM-dependent methyltransferase [uncultured Clostridium sp.]